MVSITFSRKIEYVTIQCPYCPNKITIPKRSVSNTEMCKDCRRKAKSKASTEWKRNNRERARLTNMRSYYKNKQKDKLDEDKSSSGLWKLEYDPTGSTNHPTFDRKTLNVLARDRVYNVGTIFSSNNKRLVINNKRKLEEIQ